MRVESVCRERRRRDLDVETDALTRRRVDRHAGVLHLPQVRDRVLVGVDSAGVHAAAADARQLRSVLRSAVDERERVDRVDAPSVREQTAPARAFGTVADVVAVGIGVVRIGREELVEPAGRVARMVVVDRRTVRVCVARIGARILGRIGESVVVVVVAVERPDAVFLVTGACVRVAGHVELPAVRHTVAVGVRAMSHADRLVAASLREGRREVLGDVRRRGERVRILLRDHRFAGGIRRVEEGLDVRLRVVDGRHRRVVADVRPHVLVVPLGRHDSVVHAVAHDEVFVVVGVGHRVHRDTGRV